MADASEWEKRRTHFVHSNGFQTHDQLRDYIRAHYGDLTDLRNEEIDRVFKHDHLPSDVGHLVSEIRSNRENG